MRDHTELSTRELARHVLVYATGFALFAIEAVFGTVVSSLASRLIESRFILQVMTLVEHVIVVVDAVYIAARSIRDLWHKLKGLFS